MGWKCDVKKCGTCAYWIGKRTFGAFDTIDFDYNTPGECGRPDAAIISGGYASDRGPCGNWKSLF